MECGFGSKGRTEVFHSESSVSDRHAPITVAPFHGLRVIELGAGTGVGSLAFALGGASVLSTDMDVTRLIHNCSEVNLLQSNPDKDASTVDEAHAQRRDTLALLQKPTRFMNQGIVFAYRHKWGEDLEGLQRALTEAMGETRTIKGRVKPTSCKPGVPETKEVERADKHVLLDIILLTDGIYFSTSHLPLLRTLKFLREARIVKTRPKSEEGLQTDQDLLVIMAHNNRDAEQSHRFFSLFEQDWCIWQLYFLPIGGEESTDKKDVRAEHHSKTIPQASAPCLFDAHLQAFRQVYADTRDPSLQLLFWCPRSDRLGDSSVSSEFPQCRHRVFHLLREAGARLERVL